MKLNINKSKDDLKKDKIIQLIGIIDHEKQQSSGAISPANTTLTRDFLNASTQKMPAESDPTIHLKLDP